VRRQQHHNVSLRDSLIVVRKQLLEDRNPDRARDAIQRFPFLFAKESCQQVRFAVTQP
jgi:hypothetical protein